MQTSDGGMAPGAGQAGPVPDRQMNGEGMITGNGQSGDAPSTKRGLVKLVILGLVFTGFLAGLAYAVSSGMVGELLGGY